MLLAQPIFACIVGIAAIALVVITAPLWTSVVSQLSQWILSQLTQASKTVDRSLYDPENKDKDEEKE